MMHIKLTPFFFLHKDKAKHWLGTPSVTIQSWGQMQKEFLKYLPIGRTNQMRRAITSFSQNPSELFHGNWERLRNSWESVTIMSYPNDNWCSVSMTVFPNHTAKW